MQKIKNSPTDGRATVSRTFSLATGWVIVCAKETGLAMAVIARMKFPAFAAKKNSTCLVAYVNLVSKLASVLFMQVIFASWRLRV